MISYSEAIFLQVKKNISSDHINTNPKTEHIFKLNNVGFRTDC